MIILFRINIPKNYKNFFVVLTIIAILSGAIFYFKLNADNQELIRTYIDAYFMNNEHNSLVNILLFNLLIFILDWIFGLSMFGSPFILFVYFFKTFIMSISVSAIISLEEKSAILKAFLYVFPTQVVSIFIYALLSIMTINFSFMLFKIIFNKKELNFKQIFKEYNKAFIYLFLVSFLIIIYQVYLNPLIIKSLIR